ncbi:hypothetical protein ACSBR1_028241 [Camellia fascicularis]
MKGPKATSIAHKKIDSEMVKKRKADASAKKEKASKKNSGAPKRPWSAFFVFISVGKWFGNTLQILGDASDPQLVT